MIRVALSLIGIAIPLAMVLAFVMVVNSFFGTVSDVLDMKTQLEVEKERTVQVGIEQAAMTERQKLQSQESITNTCIKEGWSAWRCMDRGGVNGLYRGWLFHEYLTLIAVVGLLCVVGLHVYQRGGGAWVD